MFSEKLHVCGDRDMLRTGVAKPAFWFINDTLWKCTIWYMNGTLMRNFPKFEPFAKIRLFWSKLSRKLVWLVYEYVTVSWKIGICMGPLSNSQWHVSTETKVESLESTTPSALPNMIIYKRYTYPNERLTETFHKRALCLLHAFVHTPMKDLQKPSTKGHCVFYMHLYIF